MPRPRTVFACDLGGTYIKTAPVHGKDILGDLQIHKLLELEKKNPSLVFRRIANALSDYLNTVREDKISVVGICVPGIVDASQGVVRYARNLKFERIAARDELRRLTHLNVVLENDSKAAAYGELIYGAAKGFKNVLYFRLGTGLGGALILDGRIHRGANNAAGEFGHVSLDVDGEKDPYCNNVGCAHYFASGQGMERRAGAPLPGVFDSIREGKSEYLPAIENSMKHLATEVTSLVNAFDPELVVIGGGVIGKAGDVLWPLLAKYYSQTSPRYISRRAPLIRAKLYDRTGNDLSGLLGISALASHR